jgi:hypothetical protein
VRFPFLSFAFFPSLSVLTLCQLCFFSNQRSSDHRQTLILALLLTLLFTPLLPLSHLDSSTPLLTSPRPSWPSPPSASSFLSLNIAYTPSVSLVNGTLKATVALHLSRVSLHVFEFVCCRTSSYRSLSLSHAVSLVVLSVEQSLVIR